MNCRFARPCDFPLNHPTNSIALTLIWQAILTLIASRLMRRFGREILCPGLTRHGYGISGTRAPSEFRGC